jgi:hypothetical protein
MSYCLLKQEINQTHQTIYDIAKWKLILVSSIAGLSLGLTVEKQTRDFHLLLLIVPLVCAYSDLVYYQNLLRIFVLATFLRTREPSADLIVEYENYVHDTRQKKVFNFEKSSQVLSSLVFSFAAIVSIYLEVQHPTFLPEGSLWPLRIISAAWAVGIALIVWVFLLFKDRNDVLNGRKGLKTPCFPSIPWRRAFWATAALSTALVAWQLPTHMSQWAKVPPAPVAQLSPAAAAR